MTETGSTGAGTFVHRPVMLNEVIDALHIRPDGTYIDGTAGGAGHSAAIAERLTTGRLIALDRDETAVRAASERLARFGDRARVIHTNFSDLRAVCAGLGIDKIDGLLLDLGCSSPQLDVAERGFSYINDARLDMRMDQTAALDAYRVVNEFSQEDLTRIIRDWGEEKFAYRIAELICRRRAEAPIETTGQLVGLIKDALPDGGRSQKHHPAMRTFQALRIAVNNELDIIPPVLRDAAGLLAPGGRMAIITFHSLEDRAVKETFAELAQGCVCPRSFPVCVCGRTPVIRLVSKKPILPGDAELAENARSHSAKLRVAEKL